VFEVEALPSGTIVCNCEAKLGDRGALAKASGEYCILAGADTRSLFSST
jgi:large subunit ribosomal protein L8e